MNYAVSQKKRKHVEEVFGWLKTFALQRKTRFIGLEQAGWTFSRHASTEKCVSAGINRHVAGNERVLQERSSEPS